MKKIGFWISSVVLLISLCFVISQFYQYCRTNLMVFDLHRNTVCGMANVEQLAKN